MVSGYPLSYFNVPEYIRVGTPDGNCHNEQGAPQDEKYAPKGLIFEYANSTSPPQKISA
jgi:hypothetical protein